MSGRVLVVGSVNVDLVVQGDRLPAPGETVLGGVFTRFHGGKGGNQAVASARLGVPVMLVAALGDDEFGATARAALAREGIGTDVLVTLDHTATGVALILVDAKAENMISVAPGANAGLTAAHVRQALGRLAPHQGDVVLVTHEIQTDAAREALRIGREGGAWTVFNPAPAGGLDRSVLELADVLVPNRGELAR
ncbi:MAG TPA: PfkB family carbohydrate kinase, partial [Candidatus Limnocylindrales bacterium]